VNACQNSQLVFLRFLSGLASARRIGRRIFPLSMAQGRVMFRNVLRAIMQVVEISIREMGGWM
jgi:hypothetical protein